MNVRSEDVGTLNGLHDHQICRFSFLEDTYYRSVSDLSIYVPPSSRFDICILLLVSCIDSFIISEKLFMVILVNFSSSLGGRSIQVGLDKHETPSLLQRLLAEHPM